MCGGRGSAGSGGDSGPGGLGAVALPFSASVAAPPVRLAVAPEAPEGRGRGEVSRAVPVRHDGRWRGRGG